MMHKMATGSGTSQAKVRVNDYLHFQPAYARLKI